MIEALLLLFVVPIVLALVMLSGVRFVADKLVKANTPTFVLYIAWIVSSTLCNSVIVYYFYLLSVAV